MTDVTLTTESETPAPAATELIEPVVEARVEAALAEEHSAEAIEVAEGAVQVAETALEVARDESQWTNERISSLSETMILGMDQLQSSISELSQRLSLLETPELLSSTLTETEELTEAVAETLAENPEIDGALVMTTNTSETPTEASSETSTEAPAESAAVVVLAQPSSEVQRPRLKARLI